MSWHLTIDKKAWEEKEREKSTTHLSAGRFRQSTDDDCVHFNLVRVDAVLAIQFDCRRQYSQFRVDVEEAIDLFAVAGDVRHVIFDFLSLRWHGQDAGAGRLVLEDTSG